MTSTSERFTALPDDQTLQATVDALEEHGFGVDVVDDFDAARAAALALIPEGATVMTNTPVTLQETGIADAINDGGGYESARNRMFALEFETQLPEMKAIAGQPDFALGSVPAITRDGTLVIASASGSQLASYAWGAASVIFVVGVQKLDADLEAARERIVEYSLKLEDARLRRLWAERRIGKILEIHQADPGGSTSCSSVSRSVTDVHAALPVSSARYWWISLTAVAPSPTEDATRLMEPDRTSPTAKTPGTLVSRRNGGRSRPSPAGSR
jgi:hypothetical protein